jgi:hypothetical protein
LQSNEETQLPASAKTAFTMPIMAPFSDLTGVSGQATVMAFQFGDGFTNMITPASDVLPGIMGLANSLPEAYSQSGCENIILGSGIVCMYGKYGKFKPEAQVGP